MARFRSRYRKRYSRRNRKLTKANIYGNRSARSQAGQIAALNRKINYISKRDRPEIKTLIKNPQEFEMTSDLFTSTYATYVQPQPINGDNENQYIGDKYKLLNYTLSINLEYYNNSSTGFHDTESAGCTYRILCLQIKDISSGEIPESLENILQFTGNTGANYSMQTRSPLRVGITKRYRILFDKTYTITSTNNQATRRIMLKPKYQTVRPAMNAPSTPQYLTNTIVTYIISSGLHYDANFTEYLQATVYSKIAFTDV